MVSLLWTWRGKKLIPILNNIKEFYFYQLYKFSDDIILMRTNKGVVSLSLIDYSVRIIDEIADYDEKFAYFVYLDNLVFFYFLSSFFIINS